MVIWSHPWIATALSPEGIRLPPEIPVGVVWTASLATEMRDDELEAWGAFVRTGWNAADLRQRLSDGAVIVRVWDGATVSGPLRGTCVVRPRGGGLWLLETLVARPQREGWGAATMHSAVRAVWDRGGTSLGFIWEMPVGGLLKAWWRGWWGAAVSVERGWVWRTAAASASCGFCPNTEAWIPVRPPPVMPVVVEGPGWAAVVTDSGLQDGWAYVLAASGAVDWEHVASVGGWRDLWYAGAVAPAGGLEAPTGSRWRWTGEVVVRAVLNLAGRPAPPPTAWITAEVSSGN